MAYSKTIKRTYPGFLPEPTGIEDTYDLYNKGASFLMEEWLRLMGGFSKEFLPDSFNDRAESISLAFWFTPVSSAKPVEYAFPASQLRARFTHYWGAEPADECVKRVLETAESGLKEGVLWVDRHQQFIASGMNASDVKPLFMDPEFTIILGSDDEDAEHENSNLYSRSMVSRYWKDGRKADYSEGVSFIAEIAERIVVGANLKDVVPIENYEEKVRSWDGRTGTHPVVKHLRTKMGGKGGRADALSLRFTKYYDSPLSEEGCASIHESISSSKENAEYRESYKEMPCFSAIKQRLLRHLGIDDMTVDQFGDLFAMMLPGYRSWRSNFLRQMGIRQERYSTFLRLSEVSLDDDVAGIVRDSKKSNVPGVSDQKFLHTRQFRGIGKLLKWWEGGDRDYLLPMREDDYGWGDVELLSKLGGVLHQRDDAKEVIDSIIGREEAGDDYLHMRHPYINLVNRQHPRFTSAGLSFEKQDGDRDNVRRVKINVFDKETGKFVKRSLKFASKRLFREVNYKKGADGGRASRLMLCVHGDKPLFTDPDPVSLQLLKNENDRWYFNASVTLPERNPVKEYADKFRNEEGASVLGVDLGFRDVVAFMHLKRDDGGDVTLVSEKRAKDTRKFSIVEGGFLEDAHLSRRYAKAVRQGDAKFISRLTVTPAPTTDEDVAIWEKMRSLAGWKDEVAATKVPFAKSLARCAKSLSYKLPVDEAAECVKDVHSHLSGRCHAGSDFTRKGLGGLTFDRIEFLSDIMSAYQSVNGRYEDEKLPRRKWIDERIDKLRKRIVQIRKERVCVIVNLILRKAIEIGASVISVEDITLRPNQGQNARSNKRHTNWCAVQIAKKLVEQGKELGIVVKKVYPAYSSMEDIFAGDLRPRFNKCNVNTKSFDSTLARLNKQLKTATGDRAKAIAKWIAVKKGNGSLRDVLRKEADADGNVLVPAYCGEYYPSSVIGWMNSDIHAAGVIALRGIRLLLGWVEPKGDENDKGKPKKPKSKKGKEVRAKISGKIHSQDASAVPDMSWGFVNSETGAFQNSRWRPSRNADDKVYTVSGLRR